MHGYTGVVGKASSEEVPRPQVGRTLCRVFSLAGDTWPEQVIAADLLHEDIGDNCRVSR
jgi:hypothetical protein